MVEETRLPKTIEEEQRPASKDSEGAPPLATFGEDAAGAIAKASHEMGSVMGRFAEVARAEAVVGQSHSVQGHTVVPLATVSVQGGFGMGFGGGGGVDEKRNQGGGSGGAGGGAGRSSARVIALADISEAGVMVKPVPDLTALALGLMALLGLRMLTRGGGGGARAARGRFLSMLKHE